MKCVLCDKTTDDVDFAIEQGWIPNFFCNDQEYGPVCPHCSEKYLLINVDGWEIKPVFKQTFLDSASSTKLNMPLSQVPAAASLYPDLDLIKTLRGKFIGETIHSMTTDELVDLINHQHQRILDLERRQIELNMEIEETQADF
jgi:hypothetical protein